MLKPTFSCLPCRLRSVFVVFHAMVALGGAAMLMTALATASAQAQTNLIVNGDFSGGYTGFSSDYMLKVADGSGGTLPGNYGITTNPGTGYTNGYSSYGDHTTGTGNMLFGDGSNTATKRIWFETVTLAPNTIYDVSYWGASADSTSPAMLRFSAAAASVADLNLTFVTGQWQQATGSFNSGVGGGMEVSIADIDTQTVGSDFTIDDIRLTAASAAPEPGCLALLGFIGAPAVGIALRYKRPW